MVEVVGNVKIEVRVVVEMSRENAQTTAGFDENASTVARVTQTAVAVVVEEGVGRGFDGERAAEHPQTGRSVATERIVFQ